jgi:hypothetical protein
LDGRVHAHFLLLGRRSPNKEPKTLLNVDPKKWQRKWPYMALIQPVHDQMQAVNYLAAQWFRNENCLPVPYNIKLLKQTADEWENRWSGPIIGSVEEAALIEQELREDEG